jgi:serine/threonine protein kinase
MSRLDIGPVEEDLGTFKISFKDDYNSIRRLGQGAYGKVELVEHRETKRQYAAKFISLEGMSDDDRTCVNREIQILAKANHGAVLCLRGCGKVSQTHSVVILTDYMANGSVDTVLRKAKRNEPPKGWNFTRKYITVVGIAAGMQYLHSRDIIHRDLKPANVLLNNNFEPFIADFGFAKLTDQKRTLAMSMVGGTPLYMAPEIDDTADYGFAVDVYAFGVLVYEIMTGEEPYKELRGPLAIHKAVRAGRRPPIPNSLPKDLRQLIERCWAQEPKDRPPFDEIIEIFLSGDFNLPEDTDFHAITAYECRIIPTAYMIASFTRLSRDVNALNMKVKALTVENRELRERMEGFSRKLRDEQPRTRKLSSARNFSFDAPRGILASFRMNSKTESRVIISSSSCDIYQLMTPNSPDTFTTSDADDENWIQFEFPEELKLTEMILTNPLDRAHLLKNWTLSAIDEDGRGRVLCKGECDDRPASSSTWKCKAIRSRIFLLEQKGPAWDGGNSFCLRGVEFKSDGRKYQPYVFQSLIDRAHGDPHKMGVVVTSNEHDFSTIHQKRSRNEVRTYSQSSPSWLQIEFIGGSLSIEGYRVKTSSSNHHYVLKGSNTTDKNISKWETIEPRGRGETSSDDLITSVKCFVDQSYSFFRFVLEEPRNAALLLMHVELFGLWADDEE